MNDTQLHAAPAVTDEPEIERMASEIARMASDLGGESDGAAHFQVNKASRELPGPDSARSKRRRPNPVNRTSWS